MSDSVEELPAVLRKVLLAARTAEQTAQGPWRRDAFRISRYLLGGCRTAHVSANSLAELLQVRAGSITTRWSADGLIPVATFVEYSSLELAHITAWQHAGRVPAAAPDHQRRTSYPASDLITALLADAANETIGSMP